MHDLLITKPYPCDPLSRGGKPGPPLFPHFVTPFVASFVASFVHPAHRQGARDLADVEPAPRAPVSAGSGPMARAAPREPVRRDHRFSTLGRALSEWSRVRTCSSRPAPPPPLPGILRAAGCPRPASSPPSFAPLAPAAPPSVRSDTPRRRKAVAERLCSSRLTCSRPPPPQHPLRRRLPRQPLPRQLLRRRLPALDSSQDAARRSQATAGCTGPSSSRRAVDDAGCPFRPRLGDRCVWPVCGSRGFVRTVDALGWHRASIGRRGVAASAGLSAL